MTNQPAGLAEMVTLDGVWSILEGVWESLLGAVPMPVPSSGDVGPRVWATITISGAAPAVVAFSCPRRTAEHMARVMLDGPGDGQVDDDDVRDAMGEFCNVIGGNVKSLLAEPGRLGLPRVTTGVAAPVTGRLLQQVDVCWPDHRALVAIWEPPAAEPAPDPIHGTTDHPAATAAGRDHS